MTEYKLWENGTPYFNPDFGQREPSVTFYPAGEETRGCVIVAPGGGYVVRAPHEGEPIAKMINAAGIHAFVLNYRVAPYRHPAMLEDVTRAVRYVRYHAAKFHINPEKIGVLGFSAGGHLATTAAEHFDYGKDGDAIDAVSSRPNAGVLCYPVASFQAHGHMGSCYNLLGENPDPALVNKLSGELSVREDMPPIFMWHTAEDAGVHVNNSLIMGMALREKNIPFELHVFPYGVHGLGLAENNPNVAQWAKLVQNWLLMYGF